MGLHGGVGPNTMTDAYFEKFGVDKGLRQRFIDDCDKLKAVHVDITVPSHPAHGDLMSRISPDPMDYTPLVDPAGMGPVPGYSEGICSAARVSEKNLLGR